MVLFKFVNVFTKLVVYSVDLFSYNTTVVNSDAPAIKSFVSIELFSLHHGN